jgi:hypothetical protein
MGLLIRDNGSQEEGMDVLRICDNGWMWAKYVGKMCRNWAVVERIGGRCALYGEKLVEFLGIWAMTGR